MTDFGPLPDREQGDHRPDLYDDGRYGGYELASHPRRYLASAIDYGTPVALLFVDTGFGIITTFAVMWVNSAALQGATGQSVGKMITNTKLALVCRDLDDDLIATYPGVKIGTKRLFSHIIDLVLLGMRPLMTKDRQSRADEVQSTMCFVADVKLSRRPRHWVGILPR